jgi:NAD(P)-dependent dehydrogenase (short-subunit alcohol dehydrogenase family)
MTEDAMQGQVVAITGASRGIGAAAVRAFATAGAKVALLSRDGAAIAALAAEVGGLAVRCDVADWRSVDGAMGRLLAHFGRLDVLVNNAGRIDPIAALGLADPADWGHAIDVNLKGVFHGMRAAIPVMRAQGAGTILNVSSGAASTPLEGWSAYCAAKAGAAMLTRSGHLEEARHGLRIMGLSPGTVATDMQRVIAASGVNAVSRLDWSAHIPPEWPARALVWMCGAEADDLLGEEVRLRDEVIRRRVGLVG